MAPTDAQMVTFWPAARGRGRALLSGAAACLLLLRALVLVLSIDPLIVAQPGVGGASIELCATSGADGSDGSPHAPGDRRCPICLLGDRCRALDAIAASPAIADAPRREPAVLIFAHLPDGPPPRGRGRIGSGSPRAPPLV
jgi:hypothetical protein